MNSSRFVLALTVFLVIAHSAIAGPAPVPVPETGATIGLLAVALGVFAVLRGKAPK